MSSGRARGHEVALGDVLAFSIAREEKGKNVP